MDGIAFARERSRGEHTPYAKLQVEHELIVLVPSAGPGIVET